MWTVYDKDGEFWVDREDQDTVETHGPFESREEAESFIELQAMEG